MGLFVVGYDTIESGLRSLHQYADNNPIQVLQILGISSILAALTWIYIPPTALAVLGVITVFFFNTAFFQALITTLPARIYKNITTRVDVVWEGIQAASLYPEGSIVVVTLWENQRWWAGLGWIPHLFGSERSPWSDESGKIPRPQKDVYALPSDGNGVGTWSWLDSEWSLDFDWTTSGVDQKEGWQYCDHRWEHPRSKLGIGSITRRRAWVRRMRLLGRHFHPSGFNPSTSKLYIQCRFNNEILTTDPTPFSHDPVWDTDLAWEIQQKPLAFLRTQRAKLKVVCFAIDAANKRVQVGYIMLDLRTASSVASPKWNSDPDIEKDAAWAWYPLVNVSTNSKSTPASIFRPEIKLAFSVCPKLPPPASIVNPTWDHVAQAPGKAAQSLLSAAKGKKARSYKPPSPKPQHLVSPKAIRMQLFPDFRQFFFYICPPSPVQIQQNQNQTLFTTTSGIPIELTPTGCYQIGFNGPNWLLNFTIAFAENLSLLYSTPPKHEGALSNAGFYFSYSFLGNTITTTPFQDLENPVFPSERISFRIRASEQDFKQFLLDVEVLVVCLCTANDGSILGLTEVPFTGILDDSTEGDGDGLGMIESVVGGFRAEEGDVEPQTHVSRSQTPTMDRAFRSSTSRNVMNRKKRSYVLEKVVPFYDARQELPVSVEGKVAGLGVSVIITPDLQSDMVEAESGGPQKGLLGDDDVEELDPYEGSEFEQMDEAENADNSPDYVERRAASSSQPPPIISIEPPAIESEPPQVEQSSAAHQRFLRNEMRNKSQASRPNEKPVDQPSPWHQYRFSIDLRSLRGLDSKHGPIYLKYNYIPFGTTAPISTHPPVKPVAPIVSSSNHSQQSTLNLPQSFCAFEFVMGEERLLTYLEAVPLTVEVWCAPDRYSKDVKIGIATVDLSIVCTKELKKLNDPVPVSLQSADIIVPIVSLKTIDDSTAPNTPTASKGKVVKVGDLQIVVSLEDFGPVNDADLMAEAASNPQPNTLAQDQLPNSDYRTLPRGPSPTFTKVIHESPPSPTPSAQSSLHETLEYRAALEIALWKKSEMTKFKQHLATLESHLVSKLTNEFQTRDADRIRAVSARVSELDALESKSREVLTALETRENAVRMGEESLVRRREEVERHYQRKEEEIGDLSRRLGEEFRARVEMERVKTLEAEAGRVRALKERDESEVKWKRLEADFENFRKKVMEGKVGGLGISPAEVGEAAVAAIKRELSNVVAASAATERRAEMLEASKKHYKAQWVRALRDLAKTKKALQNEIQDRLQRSQKDLDAVKLRMLAKEEMGSMENERRVVDGIKLEIAALKAANRPQSQDAVQTSPKPRTETGMLNPSQRHNLDPRITAEVERLVKERDSLVDTGIYSREDRLIRELDTRIGNLLKGR
ncbi:Cep120 protein-domain-containing protein [Obelidium mucronatum]|nr:Cep120 protein-domain-containing protein [Obelidium mucronatum]